MSKRFAVIPRTSSVTPLHEKIDRVDCPECPQKWYREARRVLRGGDGGEHGLLLYKLIRSITMRDGPVVALDVGTARGFSAMSLARAILDADVEGCVYTVDVFDHNEPREWHISKQQDDELEGAPPMSRSQIWRSWFLEESTVVTPITGRSLDVLGAWEHGPIDVAFLDGSHAYEDVKGELALLDEKMSKEGAIVLDDFHLGTTAVRVRSRLMNLAAWWTGRVLGTVWTDARRVAPRLGEGNEFVLLRQRFAGIRRAVAEFLIEREGLWSLEIVTMPSRGEYQGEDYALAVLTRSARQ